MNTQTQIRCPYCKDNHWVKTDGDKYECYKCGYVGEIDIDIFLKDILEQEDKDKKETKKWIIFFGIFIILLICLGIYRTYNNPPTHIIIDGDSTGY